MLGEARVGTALLTLQLRAAVQEAAQAEASFGDRDTARNELRGRLAVLVDRRRTDLAAELTAARQEAERLVDNARQEAAVIAEASALMASVEPTPVEVVAPISNPTPSPTSGLSGRARGALLALQLRTALQEAGAAEHEEAVAREALAALQQKIFVVEQRRVELDEGITHARALAAAQISAARAEAAEMIAAVEIGAELESEVSWADLAEPDPVVEPVVQPLVETAVAPPLVAPAPEAIPVAPAASTPVNVVIDAEAFARVFAAVFATMFDERVAAWGGNVHPQPYPTQMHPTQMYNAGQFILPQPAPVPVKQSFWSHAKHVDVLLLSAAMVIVLVVLAAWLV